MATQFTWLEIYQELADTLSGWQARQTELIELVSNLGKQGYRVTSMMDKDENGTKFPLKEIDPFTFFGTFNRGIRYDQRTAILSHFKQ